MKIGERNIKKLVLFDGTCAVCNRFVQVILLNDDAGQYYFAPLDSSVAEPFLKNIPEDIDSVVYVENTNIYTHSDAALRILEGLGGWWKLVKVCWIVPKGVRDWFYKLFAKYRYKIFGRQEYCMMPQKGWQERFL